MKAADLSRILDRHKRFIQDQRIFLCGKGGRLVVGSSNPVGALLKTVTASDVVVDACVAIDALSGLLKAAGEVSLSVEDQRLNIRGKGMRGDVPVEIYHLPEVPPVEKSHVVSDAVLKRLLDVLPKVEISRLERSGQLSVRCKGGELYVSCADELHGALYYGKGDSDMEFGIFPQDSALLRSVLDGDRVSLAQVDGRLVVKTPGEIAVIPTTECQYIPRSASTAVPVAVIDVQQIKSILSAIAPIASSKEASPVKMELVKDAMIVSVSSPAGSLSKKIQAKTQRSVKFGVSYQLITDLIPKLGADKARLSIFEEDKAIIRIQIECDNVVYAVLTSDE